ncbi:hypothetical protein PMAYCL1PPCAC_32793, partial [Pristionchus mayeri]
LARDSALPQNPHRCQQSPRACARHYRLTHALEWMSSERVCGKKNKIITFDNAICPLAGNLRLRWPTLSGRCAVRYHVVPLRARNVPRSRARFVSVRHAQQPSSANI